MIHSITNQVWSRQSQTVFTKKYKKKNHNYKYKALWIIVQDHFIKIKKSTAKSQNMVCNLMKQYHSLKNIKKSWQIMKSTRYLNSFFLKILASRLSATSRAICKIYKSSRYVFILCLQSKLHLGKP